jgi:DNA-binding NtrC family response regulator
LDAIDPQRDLAQPSRIIILDDDADVMDSFSKILQIDMPHLMIEPCAAPGRAQLLLSTSAYQAVICSPSLIVVDGSSLITHTRSGRPPVPFLLTIKPDELEFAQHWLDLGVYDLILNPLEPRQAIESVQQALILSNRRAMIAKKEKALADLRRQRERYRTAASDTALRRQMDKLLKGSILRIQEATGYLKRSVEQMERSLNSLQRSCEQNELHARHRALNRLRADLAR